MRNEVYAERKTTCCPGGWRSIRVNGRFRSVVRRAWKRPLDSEKFMVRRYDPATDLAKLATDASEIDFAFILLHGLFGEDGTMQGFS